MINYYLIILLIYLIIRFENHLFFPSEREEFEMFIIYAQNIKGVYRNIIVV